MGISKRKLDDDDDVEEVVDQTFWEGDGGRSISYSHPCHDLLPGGSE
jgi:hypothetical protein